MKVAARFCTLVIIGIGLAGLGWQLSPTVRAAPKTDSFWAVEEIRPGMKGQGRTVIKGTKIENFDAEVLGVLKNTSPGRDMVLCRLSGLNLDKTGVIAGMSGSPVYIQGKLLGAVAYAWPYGKEPIAGITPFCQMAGFVASFERRDVAEKSEPRRIGLHRPLFIEGKNYESVIVANDFSERQPAAGEGLWLQPLRTPLAASGFTAGSLGLLRGQMRDSGLVPMQGGGISANIAGPYRDTPLLPGGALAVALVQGDFDLSGMGTVTHIDGKRVYGWGHPFLSLGSCDFPLMTGYVHTIYPRLSLSFKMGSPLRTVGVINADVSTCIAGWLGRQPDLLPLRMTVNRPPEPGQTFNVKLVRQRSMIGPLTFTCLANGVDMEGDLPEEMTAHLKAVIEIEGRPPLLISDTFSGPGFSGARAPQGIFSQVAHVLNQLNFNTFKPVRINRIDCTTDIAGGRRTADIDAIELDSEILAPGETLQGVVLLRPYKGARQRVPVALKLPADLPEGNYTAFVSDGPTAARQDIRDNPNLASPQDIDGVFEAVNMMIAAQRTNLVVRVPLNGTGVALDGKTLPSLPPGMVQVLGNTRRTGAQTMNGALAARHATAWVIQGNDSIRFTVAKHKRFVN